MQSLSAGLGSVASAGMLAQRTAGAATAPVQRRQAPHFPPKAKHNIVLFMPGGPSQMDLFDPKPALREVRRPAARRRPTCAPSAPPAACCPRPSRSKSTAKPGIEVSELLPNLAAVDRRPLRRPLDVHLQSDAHAGAQPVSLRQHRRHAAVDGLVDLATAWARENQNLPGFVVLSPGGGGGAGAAQRLPAVAASGRRLRRFASPSRRR